MTAPALKVSSPKKAEDAIATQPPRLNERVFIGRYYTNNSDFDGHCIIIRKCGLTAEVVAESGRTMALYAARRRPRNKHD